MLQPLQVHSNPENKFLTVDKCLPISIKIETLNALYEELLWIQKTDLEFKADYEKTIIITLRKTK